MQKKRYIFSDFDGTLTTKDSMMEIILFQRGKRGLFTALLRILPWIALMLLHLYSNQKTKEKLLFHCFGRMKEEDFDAFCRRFADTNRHILRLNLYAKLLKAKREGAEVVVVTASPEKWVARLVPDFKVLGTQLQFSEKGMERHFLTKNCYGKEKVRRILSAFPELQTQRKDCHVTAYGDSKGDSAMLSFADEKHYRDFLS